MRYVFVLCNALDDITRKQRDIHTDSPAASKKVLELCQAINSKDVRCIVISLGRGKAGGSARFFPSSVKLTGGVPIIYLPFITIPFFSELVSFFAPLAVIYRFRLKMTKVIIFYNPMMAYLPALLFSSVLRYRGILDLEDGNIPLSRRRLLSGSRVFVERLFDYFCKGGALLACDALDKFTTLRPTLTYYGVAISNQAPLDHRFSGQYTRFLFSGTLERETGSELLIDAINRMRENNFDWAQKVIFEITGKGTALHQFIDLADRKGFPKIIVHGRTTNLEYQEILNRSDVGLSLKIPNGNYANTTFPSKVLEFAVNNMLVIGTDISDVRKVFGDEGALYLKKDGLNLLELMQQVVEDPIEMTYIASKGRRRVIAINSIEEVRKMLNKFIFQGIK